MRAIEEFETFAQSASAGDFARAYPTPVFVYCGGSDGAQQPGAQGFKTQVVRSSFAAKLQAEATGTSAVHMYAVFEVVKLPNAPYPDRISIGRTKVSDICLPLPLISKSHAYLTWSENKTVYALADAGTTNGTTIGGTRLVSNVPTALTEGSDVTFGPYKFKFFLPAGLYTFVRARLGTHP